MSPYDREQLETMRLRLQRRRLELQNNRRGPERELAALKGQDRILEFEENAQSEAADYTLSLLLDQQRRELDLIDAAFQRIDAGTFGICVDCGRRISQERLRVMPYAIRCGDDATRFERDRRGTDAYPSL